MRKDKEKYFWIKKEAWEKLSREEKILTLEPIAQRLVHKYKFKLKNLDSVQDLHRAGICGGIFAIDNYDSKQPFGAFCTYAITCIRGYILSEMGVVENESEKLAESMATSRKVLANAEEALAKHLGRAPEKNEIRDFLGLDDLSFVKLVQNSKYLSEKCDSIEEPMGKDRDGSFTLADIISDSASKDPLETYLAKERRQVLKKLITTQFSGRDSLILQKRILDEKSLRDIAKEVGHISRTAVNDIEKKSLKKIRSGLRLAFSAIRSSPNGVLNRRIDRSA